MKYFYTIALASVLGLSVAAQAKTQTTVQQSGANSTTTQQDSRVNRQHKQQKNPYWYPKDYNYMQSNQGG